MEHGEASMKHVKGKDGSIAPLPREGVLLAWHVCFQQLGRCHVTALMFGRAKEQSGETDFVFSPAVGALSLHSTTGK